ncbi:uncharacterized protein EAF02_010556 [Botrytis sinoallii]|uniref:uncharacterized protein n=1 Tax=Botrytis sinoallii TaxID=1463999 RepID=UPI0018FFBF69|nr:uncharacterized protein EAF02_010556 [Botrytis sinoallii]KAF7861602.1 hypothetical protein EAF02_010556 [Botrytis sinoallii]
MQNEANIVFCSNIPMEVWVMIGQISSKPSLYSLVRVSRSFRTIFSPILYENYTIEVLGHQISSVIPSFVPFIKNLEVIIDIRPEMLPAFKQASLDCVLLIIKYLNNTKELQSFRLVNNSRLSIFEVGGEDMENDNITCGALILENATLLRRLKDIRSLKKVHFRSAALAIREAAQAPHMCLFKVSGFVNLTSLELYALHGDKYSIIRDLIEILRTSPALQILGLGLTGEWIPDTQAFLHREGTRDCLSELCRLCKEKPETSPLNLRELKLGCGIIPWFSMSQNDTRCLSSLVNTGSLQELQIFNAEDEEAFYEKINLDYLSMDVCPKLRKLWVNRISDELVTWLMTKRNSVTELIMTDYQPQWRFVEAREEPINDIRLPETISLLYLREDADTADYNQFLYNICSTWEASRAFTSIASRHMAVGSQYLTDLSASIDFEIQWDEFRCQIPKVPSLTRLSLQSRRTRSRAWPSAQASRWPYVRRPRDIAYRYAHILAEESNSLRYIEIGEWGWKIKRRPFALEELDEDEKEAIHLFNLPKLISESALGGRRDNLDFESTHY